MNGIGKDVKPVRFRGDEWFITVNPWMDTTVSQEVDISVAPTKILVTVALTFPRL
jgi:hypothetical protein